MELLLPQILLALAAMWLWLWLARIAHNDIGRVIYLQQNLGIWTPWLLYRIRNMGRRLALGILMVAAFSFIPETGMILVAGTFFLGAALLMYIHHVVARMLNGRLVNTVLKRLQDRDGPGDPVPA